MVEGGIETAGRMVSGEIIRDGGWKLTRRRRKYTYR